MEKKGMGDKLKKLKEQVAIFFELSEDRSWVDLILNPKVVLFLLTVLFALYLMLTKKSLYYEYAIASSWKLSIGWGVIITLCPAFLLGWKAWKGYSTSYVQRYVSIVCSLWYLCCIMDKELKVEYIHEIWYFKFHYALIFLFPIWTFWIVKLIKGIFISNTQESVPFFIEDDPKEDIDFSGVEPLVNKVSNQVFDKAFTVGIIGAWGSGKSSYKKRLVKGFSNVEGNRIRFFEFDLLHCSGEMAIIEEFFAQLSNSLRFESAVLANDLKKYALLLQKGSKNQQSKLVGSFLQLFLLNRGSVQEYYQKIERELKSLKIQLIIHIDDLDRMNAGEILTVFKLIKSTANFHNTVYVVYYDKEYIINVLASGKVDNPRRFMEKFFQYVEHIPVMESVELIDILINNLKKSEGNEYEKLIKALKIENDHHGLFNEIKFSPRDSVRLVNKVKLDFSRIKDFVNIQDFIRIKVLELKYPDVFEKIKNNLDGYVSINGSSHLITGEIKRTKESGFKILNEVDQNEHETLSNLLKSIFVFREPKERSLDMIYFACNIWHYFNYDFKDALSWKLHRYLNSDSSENFLMNTKNEGFEFKAIFDILDYRGIKNEIELEKIFDIFRFNEAEILPVFKNKKVQLLTCRIVQEEYLKYVVRSYFDTTSENYKFPEKLFKFFIFCLDNPNSFFLKVIRECDYKVNMMKGIVRGIFSYDRENIQSYTELIELFDHKIKDLLLENQLFEICLRHFIYSEDRDLKGWKDVLKLDGNANNVISWRYLLRKLEECKREPLGLVDEGICRRTIDFIKLRQELDFWGNLNSINSKNVENNYLVFDDLNNLRVYHTNRELKGRLITKDQNQSELKGFETEDNRVFIYEIDQENISEAINKLFNAVIELNSKRSESWFIKENSIFNQGEKIFSLNKELSIFREGFDPKELDQADFN